MMIPFGPWQPDADPVTARGVLTDMRNAWPTKAGWRPQRGLLAASEQEIGGDQTVSGIWTATRLEGDIEIFIANADRIYRVPSRAADPVSVGGPFSVADGMRWRSVQFGDTLLATNFLDPIKAYDLSLGGNYVTLSADAPKARYIAPVRDFVVVAHTDDEVDGTDVYRTQWHGFTGGLPDITNWTSGQADLQRVADIGQINGLTGGEFGTIVGESGVAVMAYGGPLFQFTTKERRIGTRLPNSVSQYRQATVFWSPEGWASFDGQSVTMIGAERVDRWFADDCDEEHGWRMWSTVETGRGHMLWAYCGKGHRNRPNRLLRYIPTIDEWSVSDLEVDALGSGKTFALTLDDDYFNNLDAFTGNLDDPALWTSLPQTLCVANSRLAGFQGGPLTAMFETPELSLGGEFNRFLLARARVVRNGGTSSMSVAARERHDDDVSWSQIVGERTNGELRMRVPGRTHRLRSFVSGDWRSAAGVSVNGQQLGVR